jgi:hypothetical protein
MNTITGKVHLVMPTETIPTKKDPSKTFSKRTIVLDCTWTGDKGTFENYPAFEFTGERCSLLDSIKTGQQVTISFDLQGNKFVGNDGKERYFTSVRGFKIDLVSAPASAPQATQTAIPTEIPTIKITDVPKVDDLPF